MGNMYSSTNAPALFVFLLTLLSFILGPSCLACRLYVRVPEPLSPLAPHEPVTTQPLNINKHQSVGWMQTWRWRRLTMQ